MLRRTFLFFLCGLGLTAMAQTGVDPLRTDPTKPRSPTRPAPEWVKLVDVRSDDARLAGYRAPEGIKLEVVADETVLPHPVSLSFTEDGKPLVVTRTPGQPTSIVETVRYKNGTTRKISIVGKKTKDAIKALSASKENGPWDRAETLLEEQLPTTVLSLDGSLYVASGSGVRSHRASKPGGPLDTSETIVRGLANACGLTRGPDGWLYISALAGDHHAEGSDGSRATVLRSGAIFRCRPDGSRLQLYAIGLWAPHGDPAFDLGASLFHVDGDFAQGKFMGCRLVQVPEGIDLGWRLGAAGQPDPLRSAVFGELPGKMPGLIKTGPGAPQGLLIYNDTRLPEEYRGLLLYPDPHQGTVRAYRVEAIGATFKVVEEFVLLAAPGDKQFHPAQLRTGPDGAIYLLDRRAATIEGSKGGRILRLSWAGAGETAALPLRSPTSWASLQKLTDEKLIEALASEEGTLREHAAIELTRRGERNRAALIKLLSNDDVQLWAKIHAMGILQTMVNDEVLKAYIWALAEGDGEMQRLAADALGLYAKKGDKIAHDALLKMLATEDRMVRRAVALAMGRIAGPGAGSSLATALAFDTGNDPYLRDGLVRALEILGKPGIDALVALADSGVQRDCDRVAEVFRGLRSQPAFDAILRLLPNPHLSAQQRADVVRSAPHYLLEPPVSLEGIAGYLNSIEGESGDVRVALLEVLSVPGARRGANGEEFIQTQLKDAGDDVRLAALKALRAQPLRVADEAVLALLQEKDATLELKKEALAVLGDTVEGARTLGRLFLEGKLPDGLRADLVAALKRHARDDTIAKMLSKIPQAKP
ncbi:MAG: HEAT repeat domain-containing protein [Gemmataceae bacterium]